MSQVNTIWEINGQTFELNLQDADTAENYEKAFNTVMEKEKKLPKDGKASEYIRAYHAMFVQLYDAIFGEGAGVKILGEKANSGICNEVYSSFLDFVSKQSNEVQTFKNSVVSRYSPNRAQRRTQK